MNYLLHYRESGKEFRREDFKKTIGDIIRCDLSKVEMNYRVLVVLIETGIIQQTFSQ